VTDPDRYSLSAYRHAMREALAGTYVSGGEPRPVPWWTYVVIPPPWFDFVAIVVLPQVATLGTLWLLE
jgi:hypothetical protein